jgi:hypothetical protein
MKYVLFILILFPFLGKSQQIKDTTVNIPISIARAIALDLNSCDSTRDVLKLVKKELSLTQQKVSIKDSIIINYIKKDSLYEDRLKNEQKKFETQTNWINDLQKQNTKLKNKNIATHGVYGFLITGLLIFFLTK